MPAIRSRLATALILCAALTAADALAARTAAEEQRLAEFARRYKALQQHLLLEGAERREELADELPGERLAPAPDLAELSGLWPGIERGAPARALPFGPAALGANVRANNPAGDDPSATQSEVSVAANGDYLLVAFNDGQGFLDPQHTSTQGYAWSKDGGQTFTDGGSPPSVAGYLWDSDPLTAVNENTGEFWYAGLNSNVAAQRNGIAVVKATFTGGVLGWDTPRMVRSVNNSQTVLDKEWLTVDPASGRLYVIYTEFDSQGDRIVIQTSADDGLTWSNPLLLSDPADDGWVQGARVAVGPGGEVYATWNVIGRTAPFQDFYPVRKSTNGGANFGPAAVAARAFSNYFSGAPGFNRPRGITFPALAVDRSNGTHRGRVYVGWQECVDFYNDLLGTRQGVDETEPNDLFTQAATFVVGDSLRGLLGVNDLDFFKFTANQGQTVECLALNITQGIDFSMRIVCGDGNAMLAVASAGLGQDNSLVFTIPVAGTYYLRLKGLQGNGGYTVYTGFHAHQADDRARDHRDVFVTHSDDGVLWNNPSVRINNDSPWLDNWLPELAVSNLSKVYASWYDWRDASPALCNALSQVYLASSDDGGATWATLGALTDTPSDWTDWNNTKSNLQPNQGDYAVLFADCQAVYGGWSDARDADVNVYTARYPPISQPTLVTFASASATAHQVTIAWQAQGGGPLSGEVQRRPPAGVWADLAPISTDGTGRMSYVDATVSPGTAYEYQLVIPQPPSGDWITCAVRVNVPLEVLPLKLGPARPNPARADAEIYLTVELASDAPARLRIYDLTGREVHEVDLVSTPGPQTVTLRQGFWPKPGLYFLHLQQGSKESTSRVCILR